MDTCFTKEDASKSNSHSVFVIFAKLFDDSRKKDQSAENRWKICHRFLLGLHHAVILTSNVRTSALKRIDGMLLI